MPDRLAFILLPALLSSPAARAAESEPGEKPLATSAAPLRGFDLTAVTLPGAPADGVFLDYLAVDRAHHRVWVPAGGTGNVDVIDTKTQALHAIEKFPTAEVERSGRKRMIGPSSATIGDGFVYVGNRGDSSVCAIDATSFARGGCVTIPSSPDGVVYLARARQVWVTTPRDNSIVILEASAASAPKLAGSFTLEGAPEGYAVDDARGLFYTNLEDKDRTLRIDVATHKVTATWQPACGEDGPRGLAIEPKQQFLVVACPDHVEVLDAAKDGKILSRLDTGAGVDNLDYLPATRTLYVAAGGAARLSVATLDQAGVLTLVGARETAKGARNAVATEEGVAYVADGPEAKILVVKPAKAN
jgi:DNA-binding beta-propeller fold protein YncE